MAFFFSSKNRFFNVPYIIIHFSSSSIVQLRKTTPLMIKYLHNSVKKNNYQDEKFIALLSVH